MPRLLRVLLLGALVYLGLAYLLIPRMWLHYEHAPGLAKLPMRTQTADGIPGDAINVGLVGTLDGVIRSFHAAGWHPADPITFDTSAKIVASVLLHRPDPDAPVSTLFYRGRRQDLAFEQLAGGSAKERNHVRFWRVDDVERGNRPFWLGAATFDRGVGVSHRTGQVTHHIAPDIDAERDLVIDDLRRARVLAEIFAVTGIGPTANGRNGGGDRFFTDGEVRIGVITPDAAPSDVPPVELPSPPLVRLKNGLWKQLEPLLDRGDTPRAGG